MSFRFVGADAAFLAWYRWQSIAETPPPPAPSPVRGIVALKACAKCRRQERHEVASAEGGFVWRCRYCGELWPLREVCVPAAAFGGVSSGAPKIERAAELMQIFAAAPMPELAAYGFWLLDAGPGNWAGTAERANAAELVGAPWRPMMVKRAVRRSRRWIEAELRARGWLST